MSTIVPSGLVHSAASAQSHGMVMLLWLLLASIETSSRSIRGTGSGDLVVGIGQPCEMALLLLLQETRMNGTT